MDGVREGFLPLIHELWCPASISKRVPPKEP